MRYTVDIKPTEDLGSRAAMIESICRRTDAVRRKQASSWATSVKRLSQMRKWACDQLVYRPDPVALRPKLLSQTQTDRFTRKTFRLQINPDDTTCAALYLPKGATSKSPVPALLAIHEHGGQFLLGHEKLCADPNLPKVFRDYQQLCYGGQPPADYFASHGFAVLVIDLLGFGSRAIWQKEDEPYRAGKKRWTKAAEQRIRLRMRYEQNSLHRALLVNGITEAQINLYDLSRAIDFLSDQPQVDAKRIGAFGLSVGSILTHFLAAIDDRIKASARICWTGDWSTMLKASGPRVMGTAFLLPSLHARLGIEQWIALSHPNPVLIVNGLKDSMYSEANQRQTRRRTLALARKLKPVSRVQWRFFDGPHCFHPEQQQWAMRFFTQTLA